MPICKKCQQPFSRYVVIDGKERLLTKRVYCLDCSPFGKHNTRQLHLPHEHRLKIDKNHKYQKELRLKKKNILISQKGSRCHICGYHKCLSSLDFHHVDDESKKFDIAANLLRSSWEEVVKETAKTILVCRNCHGEIHEGLHADETDGWLESVNATSQEFVSKTLQVYSPRKTPKAICQNCGNEFSKYYKAKKYCSAECGYEKLREIAISRRKAERPTKERLEGLLKDNSFVAVGKMFGVSDNAIRKWLKQYGDCNSIG